MIFWIAVAIVTALAAVVLILPLSRAAGSVSRDEGESEGAVYRDQLKELERDRAQGLISDSEADYARAEISRRLIAVSGDSAAKPKAQADGETRKVARRRRMAELLVIAMLPGIGVPLYLLVGAPGVPAQPLEERLANPGDNLELLLAKVERHLLQQPDDGPGWDLVAPIYYRNQMFDKAVEAYRNAVRLQGPSVERNGNLAEALISLAGGRVDDETLAVLRQVLALEPANARARFYVALRLEQDGKRPEAFSAFSSLRKDAPADANYITLVEAHMAATDPSKPAPEPQKPGTKAPGNPNADDIAAAKDMNAADRGQMILGMVETLNARLENEPGNFEGWMRLVRSYAVLGMKDKSAEALGRALKNFPAETDKGRQLVDLAKAMGVSAGGNAQ